MNICKNWHLCGVISSLTLDVSPLKLSKFLYFKALFPSVLINGSLLSGLDQKDQFRFLGNCPPTPPLSHHFAISEK